MSQDENDLQPPIVREFGSLAGNLRTLGTRRGGPANNVLMTLGQIFEENPASLVDVDLVGAFPPHVLLPDDPEPPIFTRTLNALRLLRFLLLLALALIIWWCLWRVFSAYGRVGGRHLSFLAGWAAGSFQPARIVHHVHDFVSLANTFFWVMFVTVTIVMLSVVTALLRSRISTKSSNEVGRRQLGAALAQATILLAPARTPSPALPGELSPAAIRAASKMSHAAAQLADVADRTYAPMTGLARVLQTWPERLSELHEALGQTLSGTQAVSADLAGAIGSQTALLRDQQAFHAEVVQEWRDHTDRFLGALARMLNDMRPPGPDKAPQEISVNIYLDSDDASTAERVLRYVDEFVELLGYDGPIRSIIERGSIFRRSLAKMKAALTSDEVRDLVSKAERAVELHYLDSEQADVDSKMAEAVSNIIAALADTPNACIQMGSILLIKYSGPQGSVALSRNLTPREIKTLERFPGIQKEPQKVLEYLAVAQESLTEP